jgi:essential nuclear protein 1
MQSMLVVAHSCFNRIVNDSRPDITEDQREALLNLLLSHGHSAIAPEIRRELLAGRGRGVLMQPSGPDLDGDDTMLMVS